MKKTLPQPIAPFPLFPLNPRRNLLPYPALLPLWYQNKNPKTKLPLTSHSLISLTLTQTLTSTSHHAYDFSFAKPSSISFLYFSLTAFLLTFCVAVTRPYNH